MLSTERRLSPTVISGVVAGIAAVVLIAILLNFNSSAPMVAIMFLAILVVMGIVLWAAFARRTTTVTGNSREPPVYRAEDHEERLDHIEEPEDDVVVEETRTTRRIHRD